MKLQKTQIALALLALSAGLPLAAQAAPTVTIKTPVNGQVLSGTITGANCATDATSSSGVSRVTFWANSWQINNDYSSPFNCNFDTTRLKDGAYTFKAVAYDNNGSVTTKQISVTVKNTGTTTATNTPPTVSISAPASGATVSGTAVAYAAAATDANGITQVQFLLDGAAINTDTTSPYGGTIDSTTLANGSHTLQAIATDTLGATTTTQVSFNVSNSTSSTTTLPAPTTGTLEVWFKSPAAGATVSGQLALDKCYVAGRDASRVEFFLDSTALNVDSVMTDGMSCVLDTTKFANGTHTLKAVAYNSSGASYVETRSINIQNAVAVNTPPAVSISSPAGGTTVSGTAVSYAASATDADGVKQVQFLLDGTAINTDTTSPYSGTIDSTKLANGTHTLQAIATDALGATSTTQVSFNVSNTTSTTALPVPGTGTTEVWFKSPTNGATVSGQLALDKCYVNGRGVTKVEFFIDTTRLNTDTVMTDGMSCVLDTTAYANGTHMLKAIATNGTASYTEQITINIQNASTTPPPPPPADTPPPPPPADTTSLPSTNTRAVATFESLGLYWKPGTNPGAEGCSVRYRKQGESAWQEGHPMWYDGRDGECRGSLVHLTPNTAYEAQFSLPGQQPVAQANARTWSESFPVAKTITVPGGSSTFVTPEGGTSDGYVLYTAAPGTVIDVADAQNFNVIVNKPYVIIRGLTLKGAKQDGISLQDGAHDVVIEDNDISGWGRYRTTNSAGWKLGIDMDAAVRAACRNMTTPLERVTIQRNKLHNPRYGANSWSWEHPAGPQAITFSYCGGNHVFRHNEIYSDDKTRYFNDAIGGEDNFSSTGFPVADTDIYGNKISNAWDDAIEAEGGNKNVRIWGNYIDQTSIGIASTVVHYGPLYIWRNVYNRSRHLSEASLDSDERNTFLKSGTTSSYGNGRRYVYHNTTLQATQPGTVNPLGAGHGLKGNTGQPLTNTVTRNNIFHVWKSGWASIIDNGGTGNSLDYDMRNGGLSTYAGAEPNGTVGFPVYAPGHGWQSESGGNYQLDATSPGYDKGIKLPNFNDAFTGAGPDVGAHEAGTAPMKFGPGAR